MRAIPSNVMLHQLGGAGLIAAPLLLSAGWVVLVPSLGHGPARAWTVSHALLLGGYGALGPATLALRAYGEPRTAVLNTIGGTSVLLSLPTVVGQLVLDLVAAHAATTQQDMDRFFGRMLATPALAVPFYHVGPPLLWIGLFLQALSLLAARQTVRRLSGVLLVGIILISIGQVRRAYRLVLLGHLLVLAGLAPLGAMILGASATPVLQRGEAARSVAG